MKENEKIYFRGKNGMIYDNLDIARAIYVMFGVKINSDSHEEILDAINKLSNFGFFSGIHTEQIEPSIALLLNEGLKVKAAILYKDKYQCGVKEAMDAINDMLENTTIKDFLRRSLPSVKNSYGEIRHTMDGKENASIVFKNGWVASVIKKHENNSEDSDNFVYSVAVCDYNGYFDFEVLRPFGANENGVIICKNKEEMEKAIATIERL